MSRPHREAPNDEDAANISQLFRVLANRYRRLVVRTLDETHTPVPRDALATYVAKELYPDATGDFIAFRDRAVLKLHHVHIPLLAGADVIDVEAGTIEPGSRFDTALVLLEEFS